MKNSRICHRTVAQPNDPGSRIPNLRRTARFGAIHALFATLTDFWDAPILRLPGWVASCDLLQPKPQPQSFRPMEFVFVVPREILFPDAYPHGFVPLGDGNRQAVLLERIETSGFFVERARAEQAPEWKQIIPYTLVIRDGQVLCLARTKQGGETRLHDKLSLGVGGHINPIDLESPSDAAPAGRNPIPRATIREVLEEELIVEGVHELHTLGLLNDDSNPVGAVHLGWVQALVVHGEVEVREKDQLVGRFRSPRELQDMLDSGANFETWSGFLIPKLEQLVEHISPNAARPRQTPAHSQ
ncbi:MAG: hypothetical protein R3F17_06660 [Planctomycetota bacterium]